MELTDEEKRKVRELTERLCMESLNNCRFLLSERQHMEKQLTNTQKSALARIRADNRLAPYEYELMTDWAYTDSSEHWRWILDEDADKLAEWGFEVADRAVGDEGLAYFVGDTTWYDNLGLTDRD